MGVISSYLLLRSYIQSNCLAMTPMCSRSSSPFFDSISSLMALRLPQGSSRSSLESTTAGLAMLPRCSLPLPFASLKLARLYRSTIKSFLSEGKFCEVFLSEWSVLVLGLALFLAEVVGRIL